MKTNYYVDTGSAELSSAGLREPRAGDTSVAWSSITIEDHMEVD